MTDPSTPNVTGRGTSADTAPVAWATTQTMPYAAPVPEGQARSADTPVVPAAPAVPFAGPRTAPALNPPVWSGRKTAIAAALAIGISTMGAVGAAAALPAGSGQEGTGQFQPGQPALPGQGAAPADPNASTT